MLDGRGRAYGATAPAALTSRLPGQQQAALAPLRIAVGVETFQHIDDMRAWRFVTRQQRAELRQLVGERINALAVFAVERDRDAGISQRKKKFSEAIGFEIILAFFLGI